MKAFYLDVQVLLSHSDYDILMWAESWWELEVFATIYAGKHCKVF